MPDKARDKLSRTRVNDKLYKQAIEAIDDLFSDMSVNQGKCLENMMCLMSEITFKIRSIKTDMKRGGRGA